MPRSNALVDEKRTVQWHIDRLGIAKVTVQPTVAKIIDASMPAHVARGDWLVLCALQCSLMGATMDLRFGRVHAILRALRLRRAAARATTGVVAPGAQVRAARPELGADVRRPLAAARRRA